jgi:hypothetical protein
MACTTKEYECIHRAIGVRTDMCCLDMYLRLSVDDLKKLNRTSIMLADGSGDYMGIIGKLPDSF